MKLITSILFLMLTQHSATAQNASDTIRHDGISLELLDSLVILEVNKERILHSEAKMYISQTLMDSSKTQSVWMTEKGKPGYTSAKVGQCILSMDIFVNTYTYQDLATLMVKKWMESPGHKSLLMGPFFVYCGAGSAYKKEEGAYALKSTFQVSYYD